MATKPTIAPGAAGQKLSATMWNAQVYNDANFWTNKKPLCIAYDSTGTFSVATNTLTSVTFNNEFLDTDSMHSTTTLTGRITIQTAGWYKVWAGIGFVANTTGSRGGLILKNGSVLDPTYTMWAANNFSHSTGRLNEGWIQCVVGDYVELQAYQTSGVSLNLSTTLGVKTYLAVEYIGDLS